MGNQNVRANQSLVLNGEFGEGMTSWLVLPRGSTWVQTEPIDWNGETIRVVTIGNSASVNQNLTAPVKPSANAVYVLKFLCESRHTGTGKVRISRDGLAPLEIDIPPGRQRNEGQPLNFEPVTYEVELQMGFESQDVLMFSAISPASAPDDYHLLLYFTRIRIELRLQPVELQALHLDQQSHLPQAPVYLCLGAQHPLGHQLGFDIAPDNTWRGTQGSLTIEDNPQGAILVEPGWEVDHPLEQRWELSCPPLDLAQPHPLTITLWNQYTAEPCRLAASLWHHRVKFLDVQEAAYFPVLEEGESVRLGVQVGSHYTGHPLEGFTVTWSVAGRAGQISAVTADDGWAYCEFEPTAAGNVLLTASVVSLYYTDGVVSREFPVTVLATSPWKEVMAVVGGVAAPWEQKTGWPNRGSSYPLLTLLPETLAGTELALHWEGDSPEQLEVEVSPALESSVPVTDFQEMLWELNNADKLDGSFSLRMSCSRLLKPSPWKPMRLARNEVVLGEVREADRVCVVDEGDGAWVWLQVLHLVANGSGDPVSNALVDFEFPSGTRHATTTGLGGWASYRCQPGSAGDHKVKAWIKAHPDAVEIEHEFSVKAIATSPWNSEVTMLLDDEPLDRQTLGVLCRRGQTHTLKVVPRAGSPWIGRNISAHWRNADPQIGLTLSELGVAKPLVAAGVQWTFSSPAGTSKSSPFEVELRLASESLVRELPGRLMSRNLAEELSLRLDQVPAGLDGQALHPCLGAQHVFSVLPNALSPLVGLSTSLVWTGTPADQLGVKLLPSSGTPQVLSAGGAKWTLDCRDSRLAGTFALTLNLPQLQDVVTATPMTLGHNKLRLATLHEPAIDPVIGMDAAWIWARVVSHFTGEPVADAIVTFEAGGFRTDVKTDDEGLSGFGFEPQTAGVQGVLGSVLSPFDNFTESRSTEVDALDSDPWDGLQVSFDGAPRQRWGQKTFFPRRRGQHAIEVFAVDDSPLVERELTLGLIGTGPNELGLRFISNNGLGLPVPFHGFLRYSLEAGDLKDGAFALRLASQRLARLSPDNPMSLGSGEQVLKIVVRNRVNQALDWGQELREEVSVVSSITGKPMSGWTVTWRSADLGEVSTVTDYYGVASVRYMPRTPGVIRLVASVGEGQYAQSVELPYFLNPPRKIISLTSPKPSGKPGETVSALATVISALTGEPLPGVEVIWAYPDRVIAPTFTDAEGVARVSFRIADSSRRTLLEGTVRGGLGGWDMKYLEFVLELSS